MKHHRRMRGKLRILVVALLGMPAALALVAAVPGAASAQTQTQPSNLGQVTSNVYDPSAGSGPAPSNSGPTADPLRYDCTYPSSSGGCQGVGLTHGYYDGSTLDFLYTANYYCDTSVSAKSATGCEAGASYNHLPPAATSQDPLYILVPLGFSPPGLQCAKQGNCIDHPGSMDLSRLSSVLDPILHTTPGELDNAMLAPHSHFITTRNGNLPEWWNVNIVGVTSPAAYQKAEASRSYSALKAMEGSGGVTKPIPTNAFLYFQTLAGTNGAALGSYHGTSGPAAAPGQAVDPLLNDCTTRGACSSMGIGLTQGYLGSATGNILYSENYYCDKSVSAKSSTGCEAGASYAKLPPGTASSSQTDPLYIVTPLFSPEPAGLQCPNSGYCIDHPGNVDLTRLSSVLDPILHTTPGQLANAPLSPHSHIVLTGNNGTPEWWNVRVIGVTSQAAYDKIMSAPDKYAQVQAMESNASSGVTPAIPTNIFLWFQVLPGAWPAGAPQTGGGSTAGFQHVGLLAGGGSAAAAGVAVAGALAYRRRRAMAACR